MDSTTIIVPSSSASSVDSNAGPIALSSDDDTAGATSSINQLAAARERRNKSSVYSNDGPVTLPSDDDTGRTTGTIDRRAAARERRNKSSVYSNAGPVTLPSDDDTGGTIGTIDRRAAARERKKLGPIYNSRWGFGEERTMLMELAAGRRESGRLPLPAELFDTMTAKTLLRRNATLNQVRSKMNNMKTKFLKIVQAGRPGNSRDRKTYDLCKEVWPEDYLKVLKEFWPDEYLKERKLV